MGGRKEDPLQLLLEKRSENPPGLNGAAEEDAGASAGPVFWMGKDTYKVPMAMHASNRARLVKSFQDSFNSSALPSGGVVLLQGGEQETRHCTDHEPIFRQESFFHYLFGVSEPGCYGAVDIGSGQSFVFIPQLPPQYAIWMGQIHGTEYFQDKYAVDAVFYNDELTERLHHLGTEGKAPQLFLLHGRNTDSGNHTKPAHFDGIEKFAVDKEVLHPLLSECRVIKSPEELDLLRYVNNISSAAHVEVMRAVKPGMVEYELESLFKHYCYSKGGARHVSYTCICATGPNSATLHYGHAGAPNDRLLKDGDMALLDMGCEYHCYASDITCSYPVNGKFSDGQKMVYDGVLAAQKAVIAAMKPGVSWVDMHKLAEGAILAALTEGGVLQGNIEEMVEARLGAVFMPHGLGHLMGLDTHDVGGYPKGVERVDEPGLRSLRTARTLKEGMVLTVEPGCYFVEATLAPALEDPALAHFFVKERLEQFRGTGGIRLEDDVIVTAHGCENMTNCPRETWEVETVMSGGQWPLPPSRG